LRSTKIEAKTESSYTTSRSKRLPTNNRLAREKNRQRHPLFEIAFVLVRLDHVASFIVKTRITGLLISSPGEPSMQRSAAGNDSFIERSPGR